MSADAVLPCAEPGLSGAGSGPILPPPPVPDHAVRLPGGDWNLWRSFVLRGTGFPVSMVLALGADEASAAADRYLDACDEVQRRLDPVMLALKQAIDAVASRARGPLRDKRRDILRGRLPAEPRTEIEDALVRAIDRKAAAQAEFVAAFGRAGAIVQERITRIAADPRLREAALWQNHQSLRRIEQKLADPRARHQRRSAEFIAMLIQRYTLKNDSIGFFGPVVWAALSDRPLSAEIRPGPGLVDQRHTYFESWCVDALAEQLDKDPAVRPWMPPRLRTGVWMDTQQIYAPLRGAVRVTAYQRRLLDLCDGRRTARAVAAALLAAPESGVSSEAAVFDALQQLVRLQLVTWRVEVAPQLSPELELAARIAAIGDADLRARCAGALAELVAAKDAVARAAGNADAVGAALEALDRTFVRLTGLEPSRRPGETYAGRALVYEDCRRDCDVTIGGHVLERLGPPLSLMLDGAQWVAATLGEAFAQHMRRCHAALRGRHGEPAVDGHIFYRYVWSTPPATLAAMSQDVQRRYQAMWQSILRIDFAARRVTRSVDEVAAGVRAAFGAPGRLWSRARYFSPDLMIAAAGPDALRRGEFHGVLGEVHSTNSLVWSGLAKQHPDVPTLTGDLGRDAGGSEMVFAQVQKEIWLARTAAFVAAPTAWQYQYGETLPGHPVHRPAPAAKFLAVDTGDRVVMRARDGSLEFDALDLFGMQVCVEANAIIGHGLPSGPHTPRVTIGDLTIVRERWYERPDGMPFLDLEDRPAQFAAVRAWARARGMPRRVFYKTPAERKPCHLDFDSPIYTDLFIRAVRHMRPDSTLRIEEMMPDIDETWLVDADGARYTSELRIAAFRSDACARSGAAGSPLADPADSIARSA